MVVNEPTAIARLSIDVTKLAIFAVRYGECNFEHPRRKRRVIWAHGKGSKTAAYRPGRHATDNFRAWSAAKHNEGLSLNPSKQSKQY
jgi:hypothetical protein